jgi:hypothetical protein
MFIMNLLKQSISASVIAFFLITPFALHAESPAVTPTVLTIPPSPQGGHSLGNRQIPTRTTIGSTTNKGPQVDPLKGGRMMASDTRILPPNMDKMIERRESEGRVGSSTDRDPSLRGRMMASGTPRKCEKNGSSTDCDGGIRERMGEHRGEIFRHAGEMILRRMHAAIDRFKKLADRMDSRIAKMSASGTDTSAAVTALGNARNKITDADNAVKDAEGTVESIASTLAQGTSTPPSDDEKKPAKDALEKARLAIVVAGEALSDVMPILMGGHVGDNQHAPSTTASGTPPMPVMMRTTDNPMPTTTDGHHDGAR